MLGPVSISLPTLAACLVIFLVMVYAMEALVFGPIREKWAERDRAIEAGLASSTEGRDEAEHARQEVRRILAEARSSAQRDIDAATQTGNRERDRLIAQATAEFRRIVDEARKEIGEERVRAAEALQGRIVDMALLAATSVTGQTFSEPGVRDIAAAVVSREGLA